MRRSARLQQASASAEGIFTSLPHELSARIIAEMLPGSLARLALSSKALSARVAERVTDKSLWDSLHPLIQEASNLWSVVKNQHCDENKGKQVETFMALLAHLKDVCTRRDRVILRMEAFLREMGDATDLWAYKDLFGRRNDIVVVVQKLLESQLQQCVVACSVVMKPDQLMTFAADMTKATAVMKPTCRMWCDMMSMAIRTNVHRLEWSPQLAIDLAKRAPHFKGSERELTTLVSAVPLSPQVVKACVHSSNLSTEEASAVVLAFISESFAKLHEGELEDEEDPDGYYEEDYDENQYIKDRAQVFLDVTRQVMPPVKLTLQLVRALVKEDKSRHSNIESNYHQGWDGESHGSPCYKRFIGTRAFIAGWGSTLDFVSLSHEESEALLSGLASFKDRDVKACLVPIALEWIKALVQPLEEPGRRSNQKDVELAKSVKKVCQAIMCS